VWVPSESALAIDQLTAIAPHGPSTGVAAVDDPLPNLAEAAATHGPASGDWWAISGAPRAAPGNSWRDAHGYSWIFIHGQEPLPQLDVLICPPQLVQPVDHDVIG
jgi:hypothetical protein